MVDLHNLQNVPFHNEVCKIVSRSFYQILIVLTKVYCTENAAFPNIYMRHVVFKIYLMKMILNNLLVCTENVCWYSSRPTDLCVE